MGVCNTRKIWGQCGLGEGEEGRAHQHGCPGGSGVGEPRGGQRMSSRGHACDSEEHAAGGEASQARGTPHLLSSPITPGADGKPR